MPDSKRLAVLDLSEASHGNAQGVGLADFTTETLMSKVDIKATYTNALTSTAISAVRIPLTLKNDREIMDAALQLAPGVDGFKAARITDTASVRTFWATPAVLPDLQDISGLEIEDVPLPMKFGQDGRLLCFGENG